MHKRKDYAKGKPIEMLCVCTNTHTCVHTWGNVVTDRLEFDKNQFAASHNKLLN